MPVQPPPAIPAHPNSVDTIANYLNRLSQWMYSELQQGIRKDEAAAHLLLAATGAKGDPTHVYSLGVDPATGNVTTTAVPYGQGLP